MRATEIHCRSYLILIGGATRISVKEAAKQGAKRQASQVFESCPNAPVGRSSTGSKTGRYIMLPADKKLNTRVIFRSFDLAGQRRLAHVQASGRARDARSSAATAK